jgi:Tol biopolymer transport system component
MILRRYHKSFLVVSFWLLVSCSNTGNLPQQKTTPQLPLTQAHTVLPSPNGNWTAYFFGYDLETIRLSVTNFDDTVTWNVNQPNFGSEASFTPYRWSQDGRYLYFNIYVAIDGYVPFYQGAGLQRLDVLNGTVSEVLSNGYLSDSTYHIYIWNFVTFSLSPDDKLLAYINLLENGMQLVIRDMKTGNEKSTLFEGYSSAGSILWSPQQDQLVLAVTKGTNWSDTLCSIELVELDSLTSRTLVKDKDLDWVYDPVLWNNNHTILLKERGGPYLYLDITTGKLTPAPDLTTVSD